jgi:crotonobetainyl-CoA:carnitine CoA-transferase CaiB-like acyl-CoA transferase
MPGPGPLAGLTIVDLTRVLSGPYCTMLLADMGARVIKIEHPGRGDDTRAWGPPFVGKESAYFLSINRNKESVTLEFKTAEGGRILNQLISTADVVVENFRPGVMSRLGLDYARLAERHPRLVFCSISGFGQDGPRRDHAG